MLEAKQKGDSLEFLRELIELARSAEWGTFSEESAICHLFVNNVKCDKARKICFKFLRKNSDGDTKKLIAELQPSKTCKRLITKGENNNLTEPNKFFNIQPATNATSKAI